MNYTDLKALVLPTLGASVSNPKRWSAAEIEFASNQALKRLATYLTSWTRETAVSVTDASDTYQLSADTLDVWKVAVDSSNSYLPRTSVASLPTDGRIGAAEMFAIMDSGPTVTTSKAIVFYPAPGADKDYVVTEVYQAVVDTTDTLDIPIPLTLEDPLVYLTCYYLSSKMTVDKGNTDRQTYLQMALDALGQLSAISMNAEAMNGRGYFDNSLGALTLQ